VIANGSGGIDDDDGQTRAGLFKSDLLGEPLGALVVARHVCDGHRSSFVAFQAFGHADTADGAGVDDTLDSGAFGRGEKVAGAFDVRGI